MAECICLVIGPLAIGEVGALAWGRGRETVKEKTPGFLGFIRSGFLGVTSIATIDLPMPYPGISIKPENEPPSWIIVFGIST
jgi:hypothetical protein